jgi:adenylate cyclase
VRVKGKKEPVLLFELRGKGAAPAEDLPLLDGYARGLALYRDRRFAEARVDFQSLRERFPHDGPSRLLAARCERMASEPRGTLGRRVPDGAQMTLFFLPFYTMSQN